MTSIDPNAASIPAAGKGATGRVTLASVVALVLSVGGNVVQWRTSSAALEKTRAEIASLTQAQQEGSTKSIQSWIDQLKKFDTVEDRVMVLSAAVSTSPYDSVRAWAKEQMLRLEGDLHERKKAAEENVAVAERAAATPNAPSPGAGGSGLGGGGTSRPAVPTRPAASGAVPGVPQRPALEMVAVAKKDLARVAVAEQLFSAVKASPVVPTRPATAPAAAEK